MLAEFAFVPYNAIAGKAVALVVASYAALSTEKGPGLTQADAVQLATHLAWLRNGCTLEYRGRAAKFDVKTGRFLGTELVTKRGREFELIAAHALADVRLLPMVGNEPLIDPMPGTGPDGRKRWGPTLALAIDASLRRLGRSEQAAEAPAGYGSIAIPVLAPLAVGIIVAGAAVAVVGAVAAWRYLDPDSRRDLALVEAASSSYAERLATARVTGTMPEASALEVDAAPTIEKIAGEAKVRGWQIAGGVVAGVLGTALIGAAIARAV